MDFMVCLIKSGDFLLYTLVLLSFSPPSCLLSCSNLVWDLQKQTNNKIYLTKQQVSMWNFYTYFPLGFWIFPTPLSLVYNILPVYSFQSILLSFTYFMLYSVLGTIPRARTLRLIHTLRPYRDMGKNSEKKKLCVFCNCPVSNTNPNQCLRYSMKN